jgi:hypothetical protein
MFSRYIAIFPTALAGYWSGLSLSNGRMETRYMNLVLQSKSDSVNDVVEPSYYPMLQYESSFSTVRVPSCRRRKDVPVLAEL